MQVCNEWQAAMAMISIFPHAPQKIFTMTDLLAEEAGEPSAAYIQASVKLDDSLADEASSRLNSIEQVIYKASLGS